MNTKNIQKDKKNIVRSINKNVRSSTRKLNPILKSIVGKKVDVALRNLSFSDKRISNDVSKTLSSAIANTRNNYQYNIARWVIKEEYSGFTTSRKKFI